MNYNISKTTPPAMPKLGHGTECIALLLSQVSKDMHQPLVPMIFPILGAHLSGAEFMYPDLSWKEPCGMLANLVAESGAGKGQLSALGHPPQPGRHPPPARSPATPPAAHTATRMQGLRRVLPHNPQPIKNTTAMEKFIIPQNATKSALRHINIKIALR